MESKDVAHDTLNAFLSQMFLCLAVAVLQAARCQLPFFTPTCSPTYLSTKKVFLPAFNAFLTILLGEREHNLSRQFCINKNLSFQIFCGYETSHY